MMFWFMTFLHHRESTHLELEAAESGSEDRDTPERCRPASRTERRAPAPDPPRQRARARISFPALIDPPSQPPRYPYLDRESCRCIPYQIES